jgi:hypothetical protein
MSDPKVDCEALLNAVLPFAEQMLATCGELIPFAGAMRPDGEIVSVAGYDGNEQPRSTDIIDLITESFAASARDGEYLSTAIVYCARVKLPSMEEKSDAIAVALDHRDDYSIIVFLPYEIDAGKLSVGTAFVQEGAAKIFRPS